MHYLDINGEHLYVEELWREGDDIHVRTTDGREFTMKNVEITGFRINGVPTMDPVLVEPGPGEVVYGAARYTGGSDE